MAVYLSGGTRCCIWCGKPSFLQIHRKCKAKIAARAHSADGARGLPGGEPLQVPPPGAFSPAAEQEVAPCFVAGDLT